MLRAGTDFYYYCDDRKISRLGLAKKMVSGYLRSVRVMQAGFSLMFAIGGQFKRQVSSFRDTISKDGKFPPGLTGL
jgi:hypothetical protein